MISGFTPTWYPQRREWGNTFPEVMDISFRIARSKASDVAGEGSPVQICSGLKDGGYLARPSGTDPSGLAGTELQRIAAGAGCVCKSVPG